VTQGGLIGCSTDRFSIRPAQFAISSTANNSTTGSGTTVKTGVFFSMTAQPVTFGAANITVGYGTPSAPLTPSFDMTQVVGSPNAGTLASTIPTPAGFAAATGGAATGSNFYYSEVGNFGLNANAVTDSSFTGVDQAGDCNIGSFSNTPDGAGKVGCSIGQSAIAVTSGFGRFIPDNFAVSLNAPVFGPTCSTFSYVGQPFPYVTKPVITVTARNGTTNGLTNAPTQNYAGSYMKFVNTAGQSLNKAPYATQSARYLWFDALGGGTTPALNLSSPPTGFLPDTTADPTIGTFTNGVGTLTFSNGPNDALVFTRSATTPSAPFNADISLELNVIDSDNVAYAGNPAKFGSLTLPGNGIGFTSGNKAFRYGVIRLIDVFAPLAGNSSGFAPVGIQAQYWNGTALALNSLDSCTSFTADNFVLYGHQGQISAVNLPTPTSAVATGAISVALGTLASGVGGVRVVAPSGVNALTQPGSAHICFDLDSSTQVDTACVAVTPANKAYLQGKWIGTSYNKDPNATVGFGLYGSQPKNFIYFRENY
jgi:MSHA biogenesis protein MshQ